jgi:anti-sigma B factor antagonist
VTVTVVEGGHEGGPRVLQGTGELDVAVVPPLLSQVPELVDGAAALVLDLTTVSFFDSSGVRLVDSLARECGRTRTPFRVVAPPGNRCRRVLEIVGLADGLVVETLPDALVAVQPDGQR